MESLINICFVHEPELHEYIWQLSSFAEGFQFVTEVEKAAVL